MVNYGARIPEEALEAIKRSAALNRRSVNSEFIHALEYYLQHAPEAAGAAYHPLGLSQPIDPPDQPG